MIFWNEESLHNYKIEPEDMAMPIGKLWRWVKFEAM